MEIYSNTTRFALACNTSSKIIEPIQSRCAIVRYSKLGEKDILERLLHVCQQEQVCHTHVLTAVDTDVWKEEAAFIAADQARFGARLPQGLRRQHAALVERLAAPG